MKELIDLHCHTLSSGHAYSTVKENIDAAKEIGLKILGISDHGPNMKGAPYEMHFKNLRVLRDEVSGVRILKGIEANIIDYEGNLDVSHDLLEFLDYAIVSLHPPCIEFGTMDENTNALIKAMEHPNVKVIGHPDDGRYPIDYEVLIKEAKKRNILIEINNSSLNVDGYRKDTFENGKKILEICKKYDAKIILSSDAHIYYDIGNFSNCHKLLEEVGFDEKLVVNYDIECLKKLGLY